MRTKADGTKVGKVFDAELYKKTDIPAGKKFLESVKYWYPVKKEEDFSIDAEVYYDKEDYEKGYPPLFTVELEMNRAATEWKKGVIPFNSAMIFERKTKYLKSKQIPFHIQFNSSLTDCFITTYGEIVRNRVYENDFTTGRDLSYRIPSSILTFGLENIEQYAFDHVCKLIKRPDLKQKGYKHLSKIDTIRLFKLANRIHKTMHVKHTYNKKPLEVGHPMKPKHNFHWQMVVDKDVYAEYLVYFSKKSFLNNEEPLLRFITDKDEYNGWQKGEIPQKDIIIRRPKRLYFSSKYIPFHIQYNIDMTDSILASIGVIVENFEYDKTMVQGETGYIRASSTNLLIGKDKIDQYIFEYACEMTSSDNMLKRGLDRVSKDEVVKLFKLVNHIYQATYGLDKLL